MPLKLKQISVNKSSGSQIVIVGTVQGDYLVHSSIPITGKCGWMVRRLSDGKVMTGDKVIAERIAACRLAKRLARESAKTK